MMTNAGRRLKCAILDDYQDVALSMANWAPLSAELDIAVFHEHFAADDELLAAIADFDIIVAMRERTPFPAGLLARLPNLKLLVSTGRRNASIDLAAAADHGVTVCHTASLAHPAAELTFGLIMAACRQIPLEDRNLRESGPWQRTVGIDLNGRTLGILGLGNLGSHVVRAAHAFDMKVIAWSQNLTRETCETHGAELVAKEALFSRSDIVTIHLQLGPRTAGLVGRHEIGLMKPTAILVNTSRGPIVDESALVEALESRRIRCAALDVFDREPLPSDHPLRSLPNTVLTPHLGYVTEDTYKVFFQGAIECIRAWIDGAPIRVLLT